MVTHSNASKQSTMKFWRNLGELCEAKSFLVPAPLAVNIVFDSIMEPALKRLQESSFDGQIIFGDKPYADSLQKWVAKNASLLPVDQNEKVIEVKARKKSDNQLRQLLNLMESDMQACLSSLQTDLTQLWELEQSRTHTNPPQARQTYIRRGLSKLLIFDNLQQGIDLYKGAHISNDSIPDYIFETGIARKAIGHAIPSDEEIKSAINMLDESLVLEICHSMDQFDTIQGYLARLRAVSNIRYMGEYVLTEYENLCDAEELFSRICELHDNANALVNVDSAGWPPYDVWLVSYIMELIKAHSGKANGYGNQQLAAEVVEHGFGTKTDRTSASQFGGGFGFAAWMTRMASPFREDLVRGVAFVLALHLKTIGKPRVTELVSSKAVQQTMINNLIEAKLCAYPSFMPLFVILKHIFPDCRIEQIKTCFAEKAGLLGAAGNTTVAIYKHTLINWQSAYGGHSADKRKELAGRAVGLRYTWDAKRGMFVNRPGIHKLILMLDGTWSQQHLNTLINAGWDEIYYPDETDQLKSAIV